MNTHQKYELIMTIAKECTERQDLYDLLNLRRDINCYDGFEPSGRMHIGQGLMRAINTNKLTKCGFKFKFWIADWFAFISNKFNGDLKKIQNAGKLMIEIWKAVGMNMRNVEFIWSSKHINKDSSKYLFMVMSISTKFNLQRIAECHEIIDDTNYNNYNNYPVSNILYPIMQCADIFYLNIDICSLGMDQKKTNLLSREYCNINKLRKKPVILSHPLILGLDGKNKMSKSDPNNAIFMDETEIEVNTKIDKAYCPIKQSDGNPIIEYMEYIIFPSYSSIFIKRDDKNGGNTKFDSIDILKKDYRKGNLHPKDLKNTTKFYLNKLLMPVREYFEKNSEANELKIIVQNYFKN